jgi:SAM-dependent methyltransferase
LHHDRLNLHDECMPSRDSQTRWDELLTGIASLLPGGPACVLVDGRGSQPGILADRLADALNARGRPCLRLPGAIADWNTAESGNPCIPTATIRLASGPDWHHRQSWDVVIWVRTALAGHRDHDGGSGNGSDSGSSGNGFRLEGENAADIVVDMHDPDWPVIRCVAAPLAGQGPWYLTETRAFFAVRAATWDVKFGDDMPAYAAAVARAGIRRDGMVVDVGCGTGRALPALRQAVGPRGTVIAIDVTPQMLLEARAAGRAAHAALLLADARRLPLADDFADAVFAAGLVTHLPDTEAGLGELARITRPGGLLVLFHPSGRAALAARHGRALTPDEPLADGPLQRLTQATGWELTTYDDAADHFFALAVLR